MGKEGGERGKGRGMVLFTHCWKDRSEWNVEEIAVCEVRCEIVFALPRTEVRPVCIYVR